MSLARPFRALRLTHGGLSSDLDHTRPDPGTISDRAFSELLVDVSHKPNTSLQYILFYNDLPGRTNKQLRNQSKRPARVRKV